MLHAACCISTMPDPAPNPELLPSLGRLVRGLSALFWGLPAALIVCVGTATAGWFGPYGIAPPLAVTGLLLFGIWRLGTFQKQERPWRNALDRAKFLSLINFGLSPFLYWWNRAPEQPLFGAMTWVLAISALLFLFDLNVVVLRLGAMLPDETLRHETRHYTALNRTLLSASLLLASLCLLLSGALPFYLALHPNLPEIVRIFPLGWELRFPAGISLSGAWVIWLMGCLFVLLPIAMTMALLWKTKEVILDNVFSAK